MTGMEEVLAAHEPGSRSYGDYLECACGGWYSMGGRDGEYSAHVAQALAVAGFGSQHDAWAEGHQAGLTRYTIPNPYPKVSES